MWRCGDHLPTSVHVSCQKHFFPCSQLNFQMCNDLPTLHDKSLSAIGHALIHRSHLADDDSLRAQHGMREIVKQIINESKEAAD